MEGSEHRPGGYRAYQEYASWWPLLSPAALHEEEAAFVATLLHSAAIDVQDVLELGSGTGQVAWHLKQHFRMTLVDLSPQMLAVSRRANPQCRHLVADMRGLELGQRFDAVLVHDAVGYLTDETELAAAFATAFAHCRPGGIAVFRPDHVAETFRPVTVHGGDDDSSGRGARYLGWTWDPDPSDTWTITHYAFMLRHADGTVETASELHRTGLFSRAVWLELLAEAGFEAHALEDEPEGGGLPRIVFVAHRPRS